jgi:hypothetical protein
MNRVQELIDERKDELPVGLAKELLDACMQEADAKPKLYKVKITRVKSGLVRDYEREGLFETEYVQDHTATLVVELIDKLCCGYPDSDASAAVQAARMLDKGKMWKEWLHTALPIVVNCEGKSVVIVHSIEKVVFKRKRGA